MSIFHVLIALAVLLAGAWPGAAPAQQLPLRYLTQQDGLGNLSINALAQDQTGYLWVGTDNGLFRYNGAEFRRFGQAEGLMGTHVTGVLADRRQRLWIATIDGLYLRVGERLAAVKSGGEDLSITSGQMLAQGPGDSVVMVSYQRLLQVSAAGGKVSVRNFFSDEQLRRLPALRDIFSVLLDGDDRLWLGCAQSLCVTGPGGETVWGAAAGVPEDYWRNLHRAADGTLWARGVRHVIALAPGAQRFVDRTPPGEVTRKAFRANALVEDADQRMLTSVDHGLARWDAGRWEFFGPPNGLKMGGGVRAMLVDRDQGLWLGTGGHGLARWMGYDNWENWGSAQGLPDDKVFAFLRDRDGRLRIGTRSGLAMLAGSNPTRAVPVPGYPAEQWNSMALDHHGNLWSSSYVGSLMREDGRTGAVTRVATLSTIYKLLVDRRGRLWISTDEGLYVIERPESGGAPTRPAGLAPDSGLLLDPTESSCESPDGTLWFLNEIRLRRLRAGRWDSYPLVREGLALVRDGVPAFETMACGADGAVWLGQNPGVLWRAEVGAGGLVKRAQAVPLLHGKLLSAIHEDADGGLWLSTDAGLLVWNRREWRQFDHGEGLVWNELNDQPLYQDVDGTVWLASANGASRVKRPGRLFAPNAMSAIVEAAERDGKALALRDGDALPWSAGALNVTMASLTFQHRGALRFRYRLAGLETEWTATAVPRLRYAALPPGQYRLQYAVENLDTQSKSEVRELRFTILPPWWLSTPFFLLCAVLAMVALWLLYRYRVRGLRRHNAEMESLVKARTRELELSQEALRERALRDGLTKAWNRVAMLEMMDQAILKARRDGATFLLCLLDLDHFKRINDTHGHLAGDAVLRELVPRLSGVLRAYDLVGRYGGEEFLVLLTDLNQASGVHRVEAMRAAVAATPFDIGEGRTLAVTASFGVAAFDPAQPAEGLELVRRADLALYRAKEQGRNRAEYAGPGDR